MQTLRTVVLGFALAAVVNLAGCRGLEAPYPPGKPPEVADLMAATAPTLRSIQVPRAKVRQGGGPAANLMIVAQAPERFAGTIQISGNELVTLAVNENEYGLRWLGGRDDGDSLQPGYYSGPPSRCAVETLLGVDLEPEAFVEMVLGGAPLIDEPHQILGRKWDRKTGRERLTIANGRYQQELAFAWERGHWQFAEATLWATDGGEQKWLWTISHEELHEVGGEILPAKTQIRRPKPNGKGELVVTVSYQKQIPNPRFGGELSADPPVDTVDGEEQPPNAGDTWEDDWEDEEGWEDAEAPEGESRPAPAETAPEPEPQPKMVKPPEIPPQFRGNPTGLTARGDLCAGY
ncbi:MAG TPA: hypothetical protein VM869_09505 [Enhygromyxa sp.]|nr:hypothetical protein [Enhygromyxa sp.]